MSADEYPALAVVGPTGSGKSTLALCLARRFRGEIVSCDALQVHRGMDIGTAKPGSAERTEIPHHLLDLRDPGEDFSAGEYLRLARAALRDIRGRGRIPVVAGGTGFYFRALHRGLFEGPGRSEDLRLRMRRILERRGPGTLHRALRRVDPVVAGRIAAADASRIVRAYEIYLLTGRAMSSWQNDPTRKLEGFRWLTLGISWPREVLYNRINRRVDEMLEAGFEEEVARLLRSFPPDCPAFKAIGYRELARYLCGEMGREEAVEAIKRETRRYAKRQITWFRLEPVRWLDATCGWASVEREAIESAARFLEQQPALGTQ